ncbi:DUF440 family protein [Sodalis-like endosymbiont of Proechinophthirus fluctus]|nr:DUF440 family protein [Sodalis-like endosymbiont of Proechinophthirus fluctus]
MLFAEVVIRLSEQDRLAVNDVFALIMVYRDRTEKVCYMKE